MTLAQTAAQKNIDLIRAWLDAHNRQDRKALDYLDENVEFIQIPTGSVSRWKDMENLMKLAYSRKSYKELTHIFATDDEVCAEYTAKVSTAGAVSDFEKEQGLHGIDVSEAKPTSEMVELQECVVFHIKNGKIDRAREYWDAATLNRQLGIGEDEDATPATPGLTPKVILEEKIAENMKNDPGIVTKINAVCQFNITGPNGGDWYLDLTKPGGEIAHGTNPAAACTIRMTDADFVAFFTGKLSPQKAVLTGKLKIKGDMGMASVLRELLKEDLRFASHQ